MNFMKKILNKINYQNILIDLIKATSISLIISTILAIHFSSGFMSDEASVVFLTQSLGKFLSYSLFESVFYYLSFAIFVLLSIVRYEKSLK